MIQYDKKGGENMNRIKEVRQKMGLSQEELANKVNLSNQVISFYESGKRTPKEATWQKLANYLGVSVPYLQGKEKYTPETIYKILNNSYLLDDALSTEIKLYLKSNNKNLPLEIFSYNSIKNFVPEVKDYWSNNFKFIFKENNFARTVVVHGIYRDETLDVRIRKTLIQVIERKRRDETNTPIGKMMEKYVNFDITNFLVESSKFSSKKDLLDLITIIQDKLEIIKSNIDKLPANPEPTGIYEKYNDIFKILLKNKDKLTRDDKIQDFLKDAPK